MFRVRTECTLFRICVTDNGSLEGVLEVEDIINGRYSQLVWGGR